MKEETKLIEPICDVCGSSTTFQYIKSSGMDIEETGLFANCSRCGNTMKVKSLKDKPFNS